MKMVYNTGGREKYFKGYAGDCVTRAFAIATGRDYKEVYDELSAMLPKGQSARDGVPQKICRKYADQIGWEWVPCMTIGSGCKVHLRSDELPGGTIICRVSKHLVAVIDGVLQDTYDCTRGGTRCVYGYWRKK